MRGVERAGTFLICAAGVLLLLGVLLSAPESHAQQSSLGGGGVTLSQVTNVVEALAGTNALSSAEVLAIVQSNALTQTAAFTVINNFKATNVVTRGLTNFGSAGFPSGFTAGSSTFSAGIGINAAQPSISMNPDTGATYDLVIGSGLVTHSVSGGTHVFDGTIQGVNVVATNSFTATNALTAGHTNVGTFRNNGNATITGTITASAGTTLTGDDEAYNEANWNSDTSLPTKNAVRDKIEAMSVGAGSTNFPIVDATTMRGFAPTGTGHFLEAVADSYVALVDPAAGLKQLVLDSTGITAVGPFTLTGDANISGTITGATVQANSYTGGSGTTKFTWFDSDGSNTNAESAPSNITADFAVVRPAAPATGFLRGVNASSVVTHSYSEDGVSLTNILERNIVVTTNVALGGQVIDFSRGTLQLTNFPAGNVEFTGIQGFTAGSTNMNWVTIDIQPDAAAVRTLTVPATWFVSGFTNSTVVAITNGQWAELTISAIIGRRTNASIVFWQ